MHALLLTSCSYAVLAVLESAQSVSCTFCAWLWVKQAASERSRMRTEVGYAGSGMGLVLQGVLLGQLPEHDVCVQERNVSNLQHSPISADMEVVLVQ